MPLPLGLLSLCVDGEHIQCIQCIDQCILVNLNQSPVMKHPIIAELLQKTCMLSPNQGHISLNRSVSSFWYVTFFSKVEAQVVQLLPVLLRSWGEEGGHLKFISDKQVILNTHTQTKQLVSQIESTIKVYDSTVSEFTFVSLLLTEGSYKKTSTAHALTCIKYIIHKQKD